jgi:hypothetical protein
LSPIRLDIGAATCAIGVSAALAAGLLYFVGRGTTFFYDEWDLILGRRANDAGAFLAPHGGHLYVVTIAVYKALLSVFGMRHYGPYRLTLVAVHLLCAFLVFVYVRRRAGPWFAVIPAVCLLSLGSAWQDLLWPFQIGFLVSIAGGLGALLAVERRDRLGDLTAAALLLLAVASSGVGIAFTASTLIAIVLAGPLRRGWVIVVPAVMYAAWYLHYGTSEASRANLSHLPDYVFRSFAASLGAIAGSGPQARTIIGVGVLITIAVLLVARRPISALTPVVGGLMYWSLAALTRAQYGEPDANRYLYVGAVFIFLTAAELLSSAEIPPWVQLGVAVCAAFAVAANIHILRNNAMELRRHDHYVKAELAAVELERLNVPFDLRPDPRLAPQIKAGSYLAAVSRFGSPAEPLVEILHDQPLIRAAFDRVLFASAVRRGRPIDANGRCVQARAGRDRVHRDVHVRGGTLLTVHGRRRVTLSFRRVADTYITPPHPPASLRFARDVLDLPWRLHFVSPATFRLCANLALK